MELFDEPKKTCTVLSGEGWAQFERFLHLLKGRIGVTSLENKSLALFYSVKRRASQGKILMAQFSELDTRQLLSKTAHPFPSLRSFSNSVRMR